MCIVILFVFLYRDRIVLGVRRILDLAVSVVVLIVIVIKVRAIHRQDMCRQLRCGARLLESILDERGVILVHCVIFDDLDVLIVFPHALVKILLVVIVSIRKAVIFVNKMLLFVTPAAIVELRASLVDKFVAIWITQDPILFGSIRGVSSLTREHVMDPVCPAFKDHLLPGTEYQRDVVCHLLLHKRKGSNSLDQIVVFA